MCRLVSWLSDEPRSLADVLGPDGLERFVELSAVHQNGWGIAWVVADGIEVYHSTQAARSDPNFAGYAASIRTTAAVAHLRWATPGLSVNIANTHPFVRDSWAMAHNGAIWPNEYVPTLVGEGRYVPNGTTDSEAMFCGILNEGVTNEPAGGADFARAFETVTSRGARAGLSASSLNSMFLQPGSLRIVNWHDADAVPPLFASAIADDPDTPPYYDLRHLRMPGLDVAASSGFVSNAAEWELLPPASLLTLRHDTEPMLQHLSPATPLCRMPTSRLAG